MTYPETTCVALGCDRRVARSASGAAVYSRCDEHLRALLSGAFGPATPNEGGRGQTPSGVPADQRADALADCSSDGGSPETERAIAQATPGPADHTSRRGRGYSLLRVPDGPGALSEALASTSRTKAGHHIRGRRLAHGNQGSRELATRSPRLCVEPEQGAPSADDGRGPRTSSHPDFSQGAGREASPRSSSRALRGAALATQPA